MTLVKIGKAGISLSAAATIALLAINAGSRKAHAQTTTGHRSVPRQYRPATGTIVHQRCRNVHAEADCNGCQGTDPANEFLPTNNPYWLGQSKNPLFPDANSAPVKFHQATYLSGGQNFEPVGLESSKIRKTRCPRVRGLARISSRET